MWDDEETRKAQLMRIVGFVAARISFRALNAPWPCQSPKYPVLGQMYGVQNSGQGLDQQHAPLPGGSGPAWHS